MDDDARVLLARPIRVLRPAMAVPRDVCARVEREGDMTAIADDVDRGEAPAPMLFGRFRTWLVRVAVVVILCQAPTLHVDLA